MADTLVCAAFSNIPVQTGSFALEGRWLIWSRVTLYPDRLCLEAWGFTGRFYRDIPLAQIDAAVAEEHRLILYRENEDPLALTLRRSGRWARSINAHRDL